MSRIEWVNCPKCGHRMQRDTAGNLHCEYCHDHNDTTYHIADTSNMVMANPSRFELLVKTQILRGEMMTNKYLTENTRYWFRKLRHWIMYRVPGLEYPVFWIGGRICVHSGQWADINMLGGFLVVRWHRNGRYIYFSPDGTPSRMKWGVGRYGD